MVGADGRFRRDGGTGRSMAVAVPRVARTADRCGGGHAGRPSYWGRICHSQPAGEPPDSFLLSPDLPLSVSQCGPPKANAASIRASFARTAPQIATWIARPPSGRGSFVGSNQSDGPPARTRPPERDSARFAIGAHDQGARRSCYRTRRASVDLREIPPRNANKVRMDTGAVLPIPLQTTQTTKDRGVGTGMDASASSSLTTRRPSSKL